MVCGVSNSPGFFSVCLHQHPLWNPDSPSPNHVCACVCTRLRTSVCAHVYTWSSWGTPATTAVLCGCVSCHPFTDNPLLFTLVCFMLPHSNSWQKREKLGFWTQEGVMSWQNCWTYVKYLHVLYIIHMWCYYFFLLLDEKENEVHVKNLFM